MKTILIAEGSQEMATGMQRLLRGEYTVEVCHDGEIALELLQSLQPDIFILNLMLPYKDGLTLLQEASYRPPVILALSHFVNSHTANRAMDLGVGALLRTPTPQTVVVRLADLLKESREPEEESGIQGSIALHLHLLRFASFRDGYRQLCIGIPLFRRDPQQNLSKELYPAVAEACGSKTAKCVEHSIRNAIADAWKHRDPGVWEKYFPNITSCPSNKAFIACMAELVEE